MKNFTVAVITLALFALCKPNAKGTPATVSPDGAEGPIHGVRARLQGLVDGTVPQNEAACYSGEKNEYDANRLDAACVEKFLAGMRASNVFSRSFLAKLQEQYKNQRATLEKTGLVPYIFSHQRYTCSQDPPLDSQVLSRIHRATAQIDGDSATVFLPFDLHNPATYIYTLEREAGKWKIADVSAKHMEGRSCNF